MRYDIIINERRNQYLSRYGKGKIMNSTKHLVFQEIMNRGLYDDYIKMATDMYLTQGMSFFNSALVILQRPGAVCVKTENAWLRDYGRTLKPGVTPIVIMKIGGPVAFVYDISDTIGDSAPVRLKNIMEYHDSTTPLGELYAYMPNIVKDAGIYYSETPMGALQYGEATCGYPAGLILEHNGKSTNTYYSISINSTANETRKAAAALHELAHIFCGHLPCEDKETMKAMKLPKRNDPDRNTKEYEAEKTVEFVCKAMGIDYDADDYLDGYDTENVNKPLSESYILGAAQRLIDLLLKSGIDPHVVLEEE